MRIERKTLIILVVACVLTVLFTCLLGFSGRIEREKSVEGDNGVVTLTKVDSGAYFHLGDWVLLVTASLVGGPWAAATAAVSMLAADLIMGSYVYIIPSMLIKGGLMLVIGAILKKGLDWLTILKAVGYSGVLMICGYFLFDLIIMGSYKVAALSLPLNLLQAAANGAVAAVVIKLTAGASYYKEPQPKTVS